MPGCVVFLALLTLGQAAVIGVDMGSELLKISLIQPGKKLEIVENVQGQRSSPSLVAFTEKERLVGAQALSRAGNKADSVLPFSLRLFGHMYNETDLHTRLAEEFSPLQTLETPGRHTFSLQVREDAHTVEEITAMLLQHVRTMTKTHTSSTVKDCVLTVDPSFTRAQRILLLQVAAAAGLSVQALVHENAAAALYYGIDRLDNETTHLTLLYNLGASKLQVSVARYSAVEVNFTSGNKTIEHIEMLSHTSSSKVSGSRIDAKLAALFAGEFQRRHGVDVTADKKAMLKLTRLANAAKKLLSANKVTEVTEESLHQGLGFTYTLQRDTLDEIVQSFSDELLSPVQTALELAGVALTEIQSFELIGGVVRIPKVQEILLTQLPSLSHHLNGDEAMAHGAALYAANFTQEVYVKPMWFSDILGYEVQAEFFSPDDESFSEKITLFKANSRVNTVMEFGFKFAQRVFCKLIAKYPSGDTILDIYDISEIGQFAANFSQVPYNHFTFGLNPIGLCFLMQFYSEMEFPRVDLKAAGLKVDNYPGEDPHSEMKKFRAKLPFVPLPVEQPKPLSKQHLEDIANALKEYSQQEERKLQLQEAKDDLEAAVLQLTEKLQEDAFLLVVSEEQKATLKAALDAEKAWLESEEFPLADMETLKARKLAFSNESSAALKREKELKIRDKYVEKTRKQLEEYREQCKDLEGAEMALGNIQMAEKWLDEVTEKQQGLAAWQDPAFTTDDIKGLMSMVSGAVEQLPKPTHLVKEDL